MTNAPTAILSRIDSSNREACLEIEWTGGFAGCLINVWNGYGGVYAPESSVREWLIQAAQTRVNFEAKTHGFAAPVVVWES